MNKTMPSRLVMVVLIVWLWAVSALAAHAHDGPPRIELGAERINPGARLEVRGVNVAPEQQATIELVGPDANVPLGVATGDAHGDFTQTFVLPSTLAAGTYNVQVAASSRVVVSAPFTVMGAAAVDDGEQGEQRDQDEPLLAPLPQSAPVSPAQPQGALTSPDTPDTPDAPPARAAAPDAPPLITSSTWQAIALVVVMLVVVALAVAVRRRVAGTG